MNGNLFKNIIKKINETIFRFVRQPGLGKTIFLWFLTLSLVPLLIASIISYLTASNILRNDANQALNTASRLKMEYINSFFNERIKELNLLSQLHANVTDLREWIGEIKKSGLPPAEYMQQFDWSISVFSISLQLNLENFQNAYNYQDIYLLDLEGNILLSLIDDTNWGENVFTGKYSNTLFRQAYEKALETGEPTFSDIEFFSPDVEEPTGFLIQAMKYRDEDKKDAKWEKVGMMVVQISMEEINKIMQEDTGDTRTGETYLIGKDQQMRSASRFVKEKSAVLKTTVKTEGAKRWLDRESGISTYKNYRDEEVLGVSYNLESLEKLGVRWGLIAEISKSEALSSARKLRLIVMYIVFATIVFVSVISIVAAKRIVHPMLELSEWAQQVAIGDLSHEKMSYQKNEIGQTAESFKQVVDSFQAVTNVCETIAIGDFTKTVDIRSEKDDLGKAVNQMRDNLVEVVQQANSISMGDYTGKVVPKSENDMLGIALERMTRTLHDAAMVADEVSIGDYSLEVEIKGEKDMLGKALNQMIVRLKEYHTDSERKIDYLNNIPTPVHVIDSDYTIQFINKAGANIAGKTVDECIGKKCYGLFNTTHCQTQRCRAYRAMNRNKVLTGDTVAHLPDRNIPMRYTSAPLKDSTGNIIGAIEYMVDISDEMGVVELAEKISRGDYSVKVEKQSDEDRLSDALNRMTQSLRQAVEQNKRQNWLKTGQTELNNRMRGELDIPELSQNIISFLTTYLDAQVGLLYFATKKNTLKLVGSYALGKEKIPLKRFRVGEGVIGQAAKENRVIEITDIPTDFIKIRTGFGDILPKHVIVVPFSYEGHVIGVIEIASLYEITEIQREFIMQSLENIGIALNSAESRRQLKELLQKTQEQAEKLQQQQEELRQSNEELEGQTKALIASETNLQTQQEELRVINEELEERTRALEKQKADIQQKNLELMMARNEIEKKARDLEDVSKYKSEFLANMSHELRTPLNSILILSQLLSNNPEGNLTDKQVEFAKTVHSSGSDLLNLINEILDLSKIEAGMMEIRIENILFDELVGGLERIFKPVAANKGIAFNIEISRQELPESIDTDSQRVQQILKNLLSNAFKFTNEGNVTLRLYRPGKEVDLSQSGLQPEEAIAISVSDTGIGIPDEKQAVIFEAFRQEDGTTSRKFGGTGLGLSISRELAWLLGGEIWMKSESGKGSTFTLYLPEILKEPGKPIPLERRKAASRAKETVKDNPDTAAAVPEDILMPTPIHSQQQQQEPNVPLVEVLKEEIRDDRRYVKPGDKSLLIIEDDMNFSEVLLNLAQSKGFKCLIAEDGETGLHFADFYKPSAIILDVKLPGMDGWQVLDRLKSSPETRHIPVHFMSAANKTVDAMMKGAIGYLSKPISTKSLDNAFKKIEDIISKPVKKLLVVESDDIQKKIIVDLIGTGDVATITVSNGEEALRLLKKGGFDTMIMNPELKDINGFQLLDKICKDKTVSQVPIIIYSEKELTSQEQEKLQKYGQRIIVKNVKTLEGLLAETTLFLHRVESDMPEVKQQILSRMINKDSVMTGKKILIVDDDMRNVFAITSILEDKGMITVVGKNGKEGVEKVFTEPDIDLILMDIMMPVMDGYEAMRIIRNDKRFEKLPIIALTAKAMKGDRSKCVAAGASDYLAKPVDSNKLISLLRVWLYE
ncbi:MAG: response regulator [Candidatus Aminicenantes bacterium]|nr:response regulator [Candidatus Aminicenantes bacterium]NIM80370.1 response regulator [Candidatus Aminicenantes bacterium]NIN19757.1 response regulator [Candidatus Aminicenantes bacterium]NIN43639.1 response regulator [Candidatus Aminicenantes bacterium]NIN86384.1 response regulator [Candidatus Aminicenantes bacterium]